ncbi:MAG TPA: carboxypeptidase-like regulatory domain-containing protein, partial [Gemmatimonadaceae bacterium]
AAPRLDTLDVTVPSTPFSVVTGNELTLTTTMPASGISRACPAEQPDQRILHGVIRDSVSGLPLPSVSVRVTWLARTQIHAGGRGLMWQTSGREATTDAAGRYFLCGLPTERILTVAMADAGHRMTKIQIPERSDAVVLRNVGLSGEALANGDLLGSISGTARDPAGSGIAAAEVSLLDNSGRRAYTDSTGTFRFDSVASGFHVLRVRRLGLAPSTVPVRVATHGVTSVHVVMATVAAILQPVEVRAPSGEVLRLPKDVAHRLTAGQGYYILAGDARLRTSYSTSDIFRHIQGVTVKGDLAVSTRGINSILADPCPLGMPLYVNGSAMGDNTLDVVAPSEIAAIEIYPTTASMPPSMHPSPCGAIMIWTK